MLIDIKNTKFKFLIICLLILGHSLTYSQANGDPVYDENYNSYRIVAIKNSNDSAQSISNTITVEKPYTLYIPNAFSPDGDGFNDYFRVVAQGLKDYSIEIYNRWGQMVFKSNDITNQWDGKFNNKPMPSASYVYKIKTSDYKTENEVLSSGTVSLIR